jgi:G:T-mismatch repair DNA endonuclease (very short patch repair protein)
MDTSLIRAKIKMIKASHTLELYEEFENMFFPKAEKCICCGHSIFYYDSNYRFSKTGEIQKCGKSDLSKRITEFGTFTLKYCEKCISSKFEKYNTMNKSRVYNTFNDITAFAYDIPATVQHELKKINVCTLNNFIKKYGKEVGTIKYEAYRGKQSRTNTFEYKREKYGMSKKEFNEYNKSRAVTLDNLIKKHGKDTGTIKYLEYVEKQKYTKSRLYMLEKFGYEKYTDIQNRKKRTLDNFIMKYGKVLGIKKYKEMIDKRSSNVGNAVSKSAIEYFFKLERLLVELGIRCTDSMYYGKNKEHVIYDTNRIFMLDYYLPSYKLCIEYNGDYWHANPLLYDSNYQFTGKLNGISAKQIWERDNLKYNAISKHGIQCIVVWENNAIAKLDETVNLITQICTTQK